MSWELVYVGHSLGSLRARCGAADSPVKGNRKAPVTTLVGTDFQEPRSDHTIKARPMSLRQGVVNLAGKGGHQ